MATLNPRDETQARAEQERLAGRVRLAPAQPLPATVCGVDVSYTKDSDRAVAAAVVVDSATLEVVEQATVVGRPSFPYVPGLLSFRELPLVLQALAELAEPPEMVVADGHGFAHPTRLGLASHLGLEINRPTIGCAKTAFVGDHADPQPQRGAWAEITDGGQVIGHVVRTQTNVKPVYVSPGHLIDFASARDIVLALAERYRLPETTRHADQLSRRVLADVEPV